METDFELKRSIVTGDVPGNRGRRPVNCNFVDPDKAVLPPIVATVHDPMLRIPRHVNGVGSRVSSVMSRMRMGRPRRSCKCGWISRIMNRKGPDWCIANLKQLVRVIRKSAERFPGTKKIPFRSFWINLIVRWAVFMEKRSDNFKNRTTK